MYSAYEDREKLEDDLYQEDEGDSEGSEDNSELEFHLYSQLHYSSNAWDMEDGEEKELGEKDRDALRHEALRETTDGESQVEYPENGKSPSPVNSGLQLHRKKKKEEKHKKKKSEPKHQRLLPSFEEVIVIDSSSDVISISEEEDDNDDGVCVLKGRSLKRLQTSTPAQQGTKPRGRCLGKPVTVVSSSSDSDAEESGSKSDSDSSNSSDSDDLENWMILGQGNQDEDQTISLNLEGGSDSSTDADEGGGSWLVSEKDKQAQICNKDRGPKVAVHPVSRRYYTGKNVHCRNCNRTGHLSKNCPEPKKVVPCFLCGNQGHQVSDCPNKHCNNCGLPGHLFNSCSEKAYWYKQCHRCRMTGHFFDACPEIWRQYHITTTSGPPVKQQGESKAPSPACCYNCSRKGHFGHVCTQQKMFRGVYPVIPFINHYDTKKEINRRQNRIRMKVKEMERNGYFSTPPQGPVTPDPPKKKLKISRNDKTAPNHIFFGDKYEFGNATPKAKKVKQQEVVGNVKPWKPKRPVPTSRDSKPSAKLVVDEAEDFPRGGCRAENAKKNEKNSKKNRKKQMSLSRREGHKEGGPDNLVLGKKCKLASKKKKWDKKKKENGKNNSHKKLSTQMYPTDENLFIIKQRKRSR